MKQLILYIIALFAVLPMKAAGISNDDIEKRNVQLSRTASDIVVSMDLVLDRLNLPSNRQIFVTPVIESGDGLLTETLPSVLVSGRNMHYVYLRSGETTATGKSRYNIYGEYPRKNGYPQTISYRQSVPAKDWMQKNGTRVTVYYDRCGCGVSYGNPETSDIYNFPVVADPDRMLVAPFPTPTSNIGLPVNHHGRSRVQFEVDKIELHEQPYRCRSGQLIDNRDQLKIIDDSIHYALSNPNVELESISICGYASPESPYDHNDYLATNRSRALSEYIARKYSLPQERCHYSAVVENWGEFRELVVAATDITSQQRADLLQLIDQPCYGPSDYDAKERTLKTDARFANLYKTKILPQWFPQLRCTEFNIRTQLKPLTPLQLREVLVKNPELMSLDQIYHVANSYEHGSAGFLDAMEVALRRFPNDPIANGNAAAIAIEQKNYELADQYLKKAGNSEEANVLRGIVATAKGDLEAAERYFKMAPNNRAALYNLSILK